MSDQAKLTKIKYLASLALEQDLSVDHGQVTETEGPFAGRKKRYVTISFYEGEDD